MNGFPAKMTSKGQVTIPKEVRAHLGIGEESTIEFIIQPDGSVLIQSQVRGRMLDRALAHPMIETFIREFPEGELRASMYIGALVQAGRLTKEVLDSLENVDFLNSLLLDLRKR